MPQTPDEMLTAVSASLAVRTGRSLEQWLALVRSSGVDPLDQTAVRNWLRREHGVPQNSQWAIADAAAREAGWVPPTVSEYVDRQYAGAKAALRPIYDALAAVICELGDDVTVEGRGATPRSSAAGSSRRSPPPPATGWTWACASPIRRARPGCSRAAGPGRPRTRCRCGMRARWTPRSCGCYGWPTSRTADRGTGKLLANDGLTPLLVPLIWTNAFLNGYSCGGKASRNVCLILGWRSWPHHLVPSILILPRWF